MTDLHAEMGDYFSLEPLKEYNPDDPADMAQILVGTYAINCEALFTAAARHEVFIRDNDVNPPAAGAMRAARTSILSIFARNNLDEAARLLNGRSITCTAIDPLTSPIRYQGIQSVSEASGWPNVEAGNAQLRLAPYTGSVADLNTLRLFPHIPFRSNTDRVPHLDVTMINPNTLEPLVEVEIGRRESVARRLAHSSINFLREQH